MAATGPDELCQIVDMTGDAAFGLRKLSGESALRRRLLCGGARVLGPGEEAAQSGDVLGQTRDIGLGMLLRLEDSVYGSEEKLHVRLRFVAGRLPALASSKLAFDLLGVGKVGRHGHGDSGGGGPRETPELFEPHRRHGAGAPPWAIG